MQILKLKREMTLEAIARKRQTNKQIFKNGFKFPSKTVSEWEDRLKLCYKDITECIWKQGDFKKYLYGKFSNDALKCVQKEP